MEIELQERIIIASSLGYEMVERFVDKCSVPPTAERSANIDAIPSHVVPSLQSNRLTAH